MQIKEIYNKGSELLHSDTLINMIKVIGLVVSAVSIIKSRKNKQNSIPNGMASCSPSNNKNIIWKC